MRPARTHCNNSDIIRQSLCGRAQFRRPQQDSRDEGVFVAAAVLSAKLFGFKCRLLFLARRHHIPLRCVSDVMKGIASNERQSGLV